MSGTQTMQDRATIRQVLKDVETAWNNCDGYAFARSFVEDGEYRLVWGLKVQGREAIAQDYRKLFENRYCNSRMEMEIACMRFIRADVAHVETVNYFHHAEFPFEKAITSIVVAKENSEWRIVTFNNAGILPIEKAQD